MTKPLQGILVVALEQAVAAPLATCRLADAGARIIKIERAEGDFARFYDRAAKGHSAYFVWLNRGKESLVLDIKSAEDRALLERILARADVFVQNLSPGAAARAGFAPEELRRRFPRLITCSISGYGEDGPYRDMKAYDLLIQGETGLASITGSPEAPGRVGVSVSDISAGLNAYAAILEALYARERSGEGSALHIAMFDATAEWMAVPLIFQEQLGKAPARVGVRHPSIAPYGAFTTGDGKGIIVGDPERARMAALLRDGPRRCRARERSAFLRQRPARRQPAGARRHHRRAFRAPDPRRGGCPARRGRYRLRPPQQRCRPGRTSPATPHHRGHGRRGDHLPAPPGGGDPALKVPELDEHGPAIRREFAR